MLSCYCCITVVDDILIIFDQKKTDEKTILNHMNNIDKHLEFKLSEEENNIIVQVVHFRMQIPLHNIILYNRVQ